MITLETKEQDLELEEAKKIYICGSDSLSTNLAIRAIKAIIKQEKTVYIASKTNSISRVSHSCITTDINAADYKLFINVKCKPDVIYETDIKSQLECDLIYHLTELEALGLTQAHLGLALTDWKVLRDLERKFLGDTEMSKDREQLRKSI